MLNQIAAFTRKFCRAEQGAVAIIAAIALVPMVGLVALAADYGSAIYKRQMMQTAADQAAYSAATALSTSGTAMTLEGLAVAGANGFANGSNGVAVAVNNPPTSGPYASNSSAVQVVITQPVTLSFVSAICSVIGGCSGSLTLSASSVVATSGSGTGCVLQLGATRRPGVSMWNGPGITLQGCGMAVNSTQAGSNSTTGALSLSGAPIIKLEDTSGNPTNAQHVYIGGGVGYNNNLSCATAFVPSTNCPKTSQGPALDPYASVVMPTPPGGMPTPPTGCTTLNVPMQNGKPYYAHRPYPNDGLPWPVAANTVWCGGVTFTSDAVVNLQPGTYWVYGGTLVISGAAILNGTGVTIVLTGTSTDGYSPPFANVNFTAGGHVNLSAPTSGATSGIVFFEDRAAPSNSNPSPNLTCPAVGCSQFDGGATMTVTGAIYMPTQQINFTNGITTGSACLQVIADTLVFNGGAQFKNNCAGMGTNTINVGGKLALVQ